jgi:hypothetical protein
MEESVTRPRAADDFATIRARLEELRRERLDAEGEPTRPPRRGDGRTSDPERRRKEKSEGLPPPWVPTIFVKRRAS